MEGLLLGTFKIVSEKTVRVVFVRLVPKNGVCACVSVFYMNERRVPDGKCCGFAQETREQWVRWLYTVNVCIFCKLFVL